jgi:hypothetical protein
MEKGVKTGWGPPVAEPPRSLRYYLAVAAAVVVVVPIAALTAFIVFVMLVYGW